MIHQILKITGNVQGVGFRPFVYNLASQLNLKGFVANEQSGVSIEVYGDRSALKEFHSALLANHPPHARITSFTTTESEVEAQVLSDDFKIINSIKSKTSNAPVNIPIDSAVCQSCLKELFNPQDRRFRYPFINCTDCGPRYSLIEALPYDRHNTSMAKFHMCDDCETEYHSPTQRRFHAQTNACEKCGPKLSLHQAGGEIVSCDDEISKTAQLLLAGKIVAVKGIGGYHLMCDARNSKVVATLRTRKHRPDKPLAIMALNTTSLKKLASIDDISSQLLRSTSAPIVLLPKHVNCDEQLQHIAPDVCKIGCMLPYTPIHYLLFKELGKKTQNKDWLNTASDIVLVVTSANLSGEPLVTDNSKCLEKLGIIADFFLMHDRDILAPCDDSLIQTSSPTSIIRRARGFAPQSITLPETGPSVLACGAFLKNTFSLTKNNKAYLSPHIGNLDSVESCLHFKASIERHLQLLAIKPEAVVCDLHPDFYSSQFAEEYSQAHNIPLIKVQHHHAHIAAVIAEHGLDEGIAEAPFVALALDGVGLGDDGTPWGGELFYGYENTLQRIGNLAKLPLPGGDIASKEIWRLGAALLSQLEDDTHYQAFALNHPMLNNSVIEKFISQYPHTTTSSAGRWFDAITAILSIRSKVSFEGQAAMQLEQLAEFFGQLPPPSRLATISDANILNLFPVVPFLLSKHTEEAAAQFHSELVDGLFRWVVSAAKKHTTHNVVCSGGCFQNKILRNELNQRLTQAGFNSYFPEQVPANDGGISLGQAWIATQQLKKGL